MRAVNVQDSRYPGRARSAGALGIALLPAGGIRARSAVAIDLGIEQAQLACERRAAFSRRALKQIVEAGAEAQRRKSVSSGPRKQWDETSFFNALAERGPGAVRAARTIQGWAKENSGHAEYGRGKQVGSMVPAFTFTGRRYFLFGVWTYGAIEIYFQWLKGLPTRGRGSNC